MKNLLSRVGLEISLQAITDRVWLCFAFIKDCPSSTEHKLPARASAEHFLSKLPVLSNMSNFLVHLTQQWHLL